MHQRLCGLIGAIAALASLAPSLAVAQDAGNLVVIQQRKFRMVHELELGGVFTPLDAFTKGLGGEFAYTIHFNDDLGWEVLRGGYLGQLDTGLRSQLSSEFAAAPTAFESLQYYVSSAFVWSPLYGKLATSNAHIAHVEIFFTAGGAAAHYTVSYAAGPELGVGFRVFITPQWSWRIEARDAYFFGSTSPELVFLQTGFSLNLGGPN